MNYTDTILIIDDEVQIRRLLEITLSANGYKISEASTAKEGLSLAATGHPVLIILDLGLPDADGLDQKKTLLKPSTTEQMITLPNPFEQANYWHESGLQSVKVRAIQINQYWNLAH